MRTILPTILATLTGHPRQDVRLHRDFEWQQKAWVHNVFRAYERIFWRRAGIRIESLSTLDGTSYSYTWENLLAIYEALIRKWLTASIPHFEIVHVPQLQLAGMRIGHVSPFRFAIAFQNTNGLDGGGTHFTTFTYSATVSGSNTILTVGTTTNEVGFPTINSMTYNSVSCSQADSTGSGNSGTFLWYLASPSSGSNTVSIVLSKSGLISSATMVFSGTNASPLGGVAHASGSSTTPSVSVTTTSANSWVVDVLWGGDGTTFLNPTVTGTNQTSRYTQDAFGSQNQMLAGSSETTTGAGSYTMSWSFAHSDTWQEVAMEVKAAATATVVHSLALLGAGA